MNYTVNDNMMTKNGNGNQSYDFSMGINGSPSSPCSSTKSFGPRKRKLSDDNGDCTKSFKEDESLIRSNNGFTFTDIISGCDSSINSDECETMLDTVNECTNEYEEPGTSNEQENDNKEKLNGTNKPAKFNDDLFCEHSMFDFQFGVD